MTKVIILTNWNFSNVNQIQSNIDTKTNLRIDMMLSCLTLKQYKNKLNDTYITRFESTYQMLVLEGGEIILVCEKRATKKFIDANYNIGTLVQYDYKIL